MNAQTIIGTPDAQSAAAERNRTTNGVREAGARTLMPSPQAVAISDDVTLIGLNEVARLLGERLPDTEPFSSARFPVKRLRRRQCLQRTGERFSTIFIVQSGVLMSSVSDLGGIDQVLAFPMRGDVIGLDGIGEDRVRSEVIALDASRVVAIIFAQLAELSRGHICLQRMVYRMFGRELMRERGMLRTLGSFSADARVANFLLDLSQRHAQFGASPNEFMVPMRRQDMARYLGLQLETVSRAMRNLDQLGTIAIEGKRVSIRDWASLHRIADCSARHIRQVGQ